MLPIICIVGNSDSGKTTLIEKLIPELKRRGYRIGTIKHASHGFDMDQKGKDSWRHRAAGADAVMVSSPGKIAFMQNTDSDSLDHLLSYFRNTDMVIAEGYKHDAKPKIEIFRKGISSSAQPLFLGSPDLAALVTDAEIETECEKFGLEDIAAIADFIETRFLSKNNTDI
ncbi:MAG: molybdopterin-guanine dinucleotide biosynthesis protein B [Desulfobacteraceae bacterium]|nr:molybdopterin-guanine dinucleotide biosynthesis protein B [Desulfobacteraceae bacterium]